MTDTWGSDYASIEVEPEALRGYATRCYEAADKFSPGTFLSETYIPESAFSSWRSFNELATKYGHAVPEMTAEGLSDTYNEIQGATSARLYTIQDRIDALALGVRQTANALEEQDATNSGSIADTMDPEVDTTPDGRNDW